MAAVAEDPYRFMRTFGLDLSELTSESYRTLMGERDVYSLELANHTFREVPITTPVDSFQRIRLHEGAQDQIYLIFRNSDHYLVGFQRGVQVFYFSDCIVPNAPGAELIELKTKSTHGALSQGEGGNDTTVGGIVIVQAYHELLRYLPDAPLTDAIWKAFHRNVLVFCEAERFRSARAHVCRMIDNYICESMPDNTFVRFKSWGTLSEVGLEARQEEAAQQEAAQEEGTALNVEPIGAVPPRVQRLNINSMQELVGEPNGELLLLLYAPGFGI